MSPVGHQGGTRVLGGSDGCAPAGILDDSVGYDELWWPMKAFIPSDCYVLEWETQVLKDTGNGLRNFAKYQVGPRAASMGRRV